MLFAEQVPIVRIRSSCLVLVLTEEQPVDFIFPYQPDYGTMCEECSRAQEASDLIYEEINKVLNDESVIFEPLRIEKYMRGLATPCAFTNSGVKHQVQRRLEIQKIGFPGKVIAKVISAYEPFTHTAQRCIMGKCMRVIISIVGQNNYMIDYIKQRCIDFLIKQCQPNASIGEVTIITRDECRTENVTHEAIGLYFKDRVVFAPERGYGRIELITPPLVTGEGGRELEMYNIEGLVDPPPSYEPPNDMYHTSS